MSTSRANPYARQSTALQARLPRTLLFATDLQQSVLAELGASNPNPFAYSPYGFQSSPHLAGTHLGFNGQLKEHSTGWYHLGNGYRMYNPLLKRFHSPDRLSPFGKGGVNAYVYCSGMPVGRVDPTGRFWLALVSSVVGFASNFVFVAAAVNKSAAAIVSGTPQRMLTRVGNTVSLWGGVLGIPSRAVGLPAAVVTPMPAGLPLGANLGSVVSQSLMTVGTAKQNVAIAQTWMKAAAKNGQSIQKVILEATKEASGWNLLLGQAPGQVAHRSPDVPLAEVVTERRLSDSAGAVDQARQIRAVGSTGL